MNKKWNLNSEQLFQQELTSHHKKLKKIKADISLKKGSPSRVDKTGIKQLMRIKEMVDRRLGNINDDILFNRGNQRQRYMQGQTTLPPVESIIKPHSDLQLFKKVQLIDNKFFTFQAFLEEESILLSLKNSENKKQKYQLRLPRQFCNRLINEKFKGNLQRLGELIKLEGEKPVLNLTEEQLAIINSKYPESISQSYSKASDKKKQNSVKATKQEKETEQFVFEYMKKGSDSSEQRSADQPRAELKTGNKPKFTTQKFNLLIEPKKPQQQSLPLQQKKKSSIQANSSKSKSFQVQDFKEHSMSRKEKGYQQKYGDLRAETEEDCYLDDQVFDKRQSVNSARSYRITKGKRCSTEHHDQSYDEDYFNSSEINWPPNPSKMTRPPSHLQSQGVQLPIGGAAPLQKIRQVYKQQQDQEDDEQNPLKYQIMQNIKKRRRKLKQY